MPGGLFGGPDNPAQAKRCHSAEHRAMPCAVQASKGHSVTQHCDELSLIGDAVGVGQQGDLLCYCCLNNE